MCPVAWPWQDWRPSVIPDWVETIKAIKKRNPTAVVVGTFHTTEVLAISKRFPQFAMRFSFLVVEVSKVHVVCKLNCSKRSTNRPIQLRFSMWVDMLVE